MLKSLLGMTDEETILNPLSPDMKMHILLTVLHTFLMELDWRICLNIKHLVLGDHFLYSHYFND